MISVLTTRSRKTWIPLLCTLFVLATHHAYSVAPVTLDVVPQAIAPEYTGSVALDIGFMSAESEIRVELYADVDESGTVSSSDERIWSYRYDPALGASNKGMFHDEAPGDGAKILLNVRLFTPLGYPYAQGRYVFRVYQTSTPAFPADHAFNVQATVPTGQSVTGTVADDSVQPVGGALVVLVPLDDECDGPEYSAFTNSSGIYTIELPEDVACVQRLAVSLAPGHVGSLADAVPLELDGDGSHDASFTLAEGDVGYTVSGTLSYLQWGDSPVEGALVFAEEEDNGLLSVAFTDETGAFSMPLDAGSWYIRADDPINLAIQGAVTRDRDDDPPFTVTSCRNVGRLWAPEAQAWVSGHVYTEGGAVDSVATPGVRVEAGNNFDMDTYLHSEWISDDTGAYTLPVLADHSEGPGPLGAFQMSWHLGIENPPYGVVAGSNMVIVEEGIDPPETDLTLYETALRVRGRFIDPGGTPLEGLCLRAEAPGETYYHSQARVGCDGTYEIAVVDGDWQLSTGGSDLASAATGLELPWTMQSVSVTGEDVEDVDFTFGRGAMPLSIFNVSGAYAQPGGQVLVEGVGMPENPIVRIGGEQASVVLSRPDMGMIAVTVPLSLGAGTHTVVVEDADTGQTSNEICIELSGEAFSAACTVSPSISPQISPAHVFIYEDEVFVSAGPNGSAPLPDATDIYSIVVSEGDHESANTYAGIGCEFLSVGTIEPDPGVQVIGQVQTPQGEPAANVVVEWHFQANRGRVITGEDGSFSTRVDSDILYEDIELAVGPPPGSRHGGSQITLSYAGVDPLDTGTLTLQEGPVLSGTLVDHDGRPIYGMVMAMNPETGAGAFAMSCACTGHFTLPVPSGTPRMVIWHSGKGGMGVAPSVSLQKDTHVPWNILIGAYDDFAPSPRLRLSADSMHHAAPGQPVHLEVENLPWTGETEVRFYKQDGSHVVGTSTELDLKRGIVVTRVPASAETGEVRVFADGEESPARPFAIEDGAWSGGSHDVTCHVENSSGYSMSGVLCLLMVEADDGSCESDELLFDYGVTNASGDAVLEHPGNGEDGILVVWPDPEFDESQAKLVTMNPTSLVVPFQIDMGEAYTAHVIDHNGDDVANARIYAEGDCGFDTTLTSDYGYATLRVGEGCSWDFEIVGPTGSRHGLVTTSASGGADFGDVTLPQRVLMSSGVVDPDGAGIPLLEVGAFSEGETFEDYFYGYTDASGAFLGTVPPVDTFGVYVQGPDHMTDANAQSSTMGMDYVDLEGFSLAGAALLTGEVLEADTLTPRGEQGLGAFPIDGETPGEGVAFAQSCEDGSYRLKVPAGTWGLQAFVFEGDTHMNGWYDDEGAQWCHLDADTVTVSVGDELSELDLHLPRSTRVEGSVTYRLLGVDEATVTATNGGLGSCSVEAPVTFGGYGMDLPLGSGYKVTADSPGLSYSVCYDGHHGCTTFTPVETQASSTTTVNFELGTTPGEVSPPQAQPLVVGKNLDGTLTLTFDEYLDEENPAETYNVYEGSFGATAIDQSYCVLYPGADLGEASEGRFSYSLTPSAGSHWYLTTASNVLGEGLAGHGRTIATPCGGTPGALLALPEPGSRETPQLEQRIAPRPSALRRYEPAPLVDAAAEERAPDPTLWTGSFEKRSQWARALVQEELLWSFEPEARRVIVNGDAWRSLGEDGRRRSARELSRWMRGQDLPGTFTLVSKENGEELGRYRRFFGWRE